MTIPPVIVFDALEYSAYEKIPWITKLADFIIRINEIPSIKMIGICFGHQIIAEALGGRGSYITSLNSEQG